jgi:uncharacterized protein (TIGR03084 family)
MPADLGALIQDLAAETAALQQIIDALSDADWRLCTPAEGWTIADQVSHLAFFDEMAVTAAIAPERFAAAVDQMIAEGNADPDAIAERFRQLSPADLRDWFTRARSRVLSVFAGLEPSARVPWFGPSMSVPSSVTARLMETWAHGQDIADSIGLQRAATDRLRHVAHIGVGARSYSFAAHGLPLPAEPVRVELRAPSGALWTWGPAEAADRISGPALDFCLLVTQRRHRSDTEVQAVGRGAQRWLCIAQCFAGPPGPGRRPGQFATR